MTGGVWDKGTPIEENFYNWKGDPVLNQPRDPGFAEDDFLMVDLFCGCGGFSIGFEAAGFKPFLGLDIHLPSIATYACNHPCSYTILGDIRKVDEGMVLDIAKGRNVSIVMAGVPCQGFSLCNRKRSDKDERNFLFMEFIKYIRLLQPDVVLLENVSGLKYAANGGFKEAILDFIQESGYNADFRTLSATDYGVPQKRQRIFFLGMKEGVNIRWPAPTHGGRERPYVTVWEAIGDLPELEAGQSASDYDKEPFSEYQRVMRRECTVLLNHEAPNHPRETVDKITNTLPGAPMYPKFKQRIRLDPDAVSPTQVSGGIRPQFQFGHPKQGRGLTVRERCRIQSIPDQYEILGGIVQGRVQTGNAVPALLAKAIARQIIAVLHNEP